MDEGFTAAAYPDVQENLKLTVDEQVIPEEPVSFIRTLSSLQHLAKDFSFVKDGGYSSVKDAYESSFRARFKDLPTSDIKEILLQRMLEENYDKGHYEQAYSSGDEVGRDHIPTVNLRPQLGGNLSLKTDRPLQNLLGLLPSYDFDLCQNNKLGPPALESDICTSTG
ncbi:hypothetical protein Tco_0140704 [Tanacetum coccineum]